MLEGPGLGDVEGGAEEAMSSRVGDVAPDTVAVVGRAKDAHSGAVAAGCVVAGVVTAANGAVGVCDVVGLARGEGV